MFIGPDAFRNFVAFLPELRKNPLGTRLLPAAPRGYPDGWGAGRRWDGPASPFEAVRVMNLRHNLRALGRVVADLVTGHPVGHDLTRCRLARFGEPRKAA